MNKLITFLKEAKVELMKVNWPTRQQTINYTLVVIGISLAVAIFLGGMDYIFENLIRKIIVQ
jgi:preprotein translocase subunit SecE